MTATTLTHPADIAANLTAARQFVADLHAQTVADAPAGHQVSPDASASLHLAELFLGSLADCLAGGGAYYTDAEAADLAAYKRERDADSTARPTYLVGRAVESGDLVDDQQVCEVAA